MNGRPNASRFFDAGKRLARGLRRELTLLVAVALGLTLATGVVGVWLRSDASASPYERALQIRSTTASVVVWFGRELGATYAAAPVPATIVTVFGLVIAMPLGWAFGMRGHPSERNLRAIGLALSGGVLRASVVLGVLFAAAAFELDGGHAELRRQAMRWLVRGWLGCTLSVLPALALTVAVRATTKRWWRGAAGSALLLGGLFVLRSLVAAKWGVTATFWLGSPGPLLLSALTDSVAKGVALALGWAALPTLLSARRSLPPATLDLATQGGVR